MIYGLTLCVILLGLQMALQGQHILLTIISLVTGSILGEALGIEEKLEQVGTWLAARVQKAKEREMQGRRPLWKDSCPPVSCTVWGPWPL